MENELLWALQMTPRLKVVDAVNYMSILVQNKCHIGCNIHVAILVLNDSDSNYDVDIATRSRQIKRYLQQRYNIGIVG